MNPNPYHSSDTEQSGVEHLRSVRWWVAGSLFAALSAFAPLQSGIHLLGQELDLFPVTYGVYEIEINGVPVSNRLFMLSSLLMGGLLVGIAVACFLRARRNHRRNVTVHASVSRTIG